MSIYEFDSNGYRGLFGGEQWERELVFPKGTIFTAHGLLIVNTGYSKGSIPLRKIGQDSVSLTIEGDYPRAEGVVHGAGNFLIKKL